MGVIGGAIIGRVGTIAGWLRPGKPSKPGRTPAARGQRPAFDQEILKTLRDFLDRIGEPWWAEWVAIAMEDGRFPETARRSPPMTLEDLVVGIERLDRVPPHLLPWANAVLDCLRCLLSDVRARDPGSLEGAGPDRPRLLPSEFRARCQDCLEATCRRDPDDAVRIAVRRSVERGCRERSLEHLLILGRLDGIPPNGNRTSGWPGREE